MKKLIFIFLCLLFCFTSCQKNKNKSETIVLKAADIHPENYPTVVGLQEFARLVEQRSDGRIKIQILSNGTEGDETTILEKVQFGKLDFARVSISPLSTFDEELEIFLLPNIFSNDIHFWKVLESPIGDSLLKSLEAHGFYGLCYYDSGARSFYTTKKINSLNDLKGKKIRVQRSPIMVDFVQTLGAIPIPLDYSGIEQALISGDIDGAENNIPSWESANHYKAAKYYFKNEHMRIPEMIIASKKTISALSEEDFKIIKEAAEDSSSVEKMAWLEYEQTSLEKVKKEGVEIITPSQNQLKKEMEEVQKVLSKRYSQSQKELIKQIEQIK